MSRIKQYLLKHIEDTIVLAILGAVVFINYFVYANKLAFLDLFYLLVVLAGYYIGKRFAILGAFFTILMVWVFILVDRNKYYSIGDTFAANLNLTVWGGFLILAAWLIGSLSEKRKLELQASRRLCEELELSNRGLIERNRPTVLTRVISPDTAAVVRDFMVGVVSENGTGKRAALPGYRVAGKTGTTEKYDIKARGYSKTRLIASFVGFLPAYKPALTILVLVEEPAQGRFGGVVAAPVFRNIAARALPLLGIWPEGHTKPLSPDEVVKK